MIFRTGRRNGHTIYLQRGDVATELDVFVGSAVSPAVARLIAVAATAGLAHHPSILTGEGPLREALAIEAARGREGGGCPTK